MKAATRIRQLVEATGLSRSKAKALIRQRRACPHTDTVAGLNTDARFCRGCGSWRRTTAAKPTGENPGT